jgi:hypothetical protein
MVRLPAHSQEPRIPAPTLTTARVRQLHKRRGNTDHGTLVGSGLAAGDRVEITWTHGTRPTHWVGTVTRDNGNGTYESTDLAVDREEQHGKLGSTGGPEDVSVTVTNGDGASAPAAAPAVPMVP